MGKKSCEKGKSMLWNAPSHDDMLTWLSLCKNVSLLVASHSILLADTVASLSLLGVLRPPGPRGPPPAARRSTLRTTSSGGNGSLQAHFRLSLLQRMVPPFAGNYLKRWSPAMGNEGHFQQAGLPTFTRLHRTTSNGSLMRDYPEAVMSKQAMEQIGCIF